MIFIYVHWFSMIFIDFRGFSLISIYLHVFSQIFLILLAGLAGLAGWAGWLGWPGWLARLAAGLAGLAGLCAVFIVFSCIWAKNVHFAWDRWSSSSKTMCFHAFEGSHSSVPQQAAASHHHRPSNKTARTPTDESVWGKRQMTLGEAPQTYSGSGVWSSGVVVAMQWHLQNGSGLLY